MTERALETTCTKRYRHRRRLSIGATPYRSGQREALAPAGVTEVIVAGLTNAYSGYVATREEYRKQHYEGASTHFGPWTLAALQQEFDKLAQAMKAGAPSARGPTPRDLSAVVVGFQPGVVYDDKLLWVAFGSVVKGQDVKATVGLMSSWLTLLQNEAEAITHVGAAFDNPIESFRNNLFPGYKTHKPYLRTTAQPK